MSSSIVVVGSCMIDFTSYAARLPKEGETIHGSKFVTAFGGKGANQCVAAAKLGGTTALVARVGDDMWGTKYVKNLEELHVNTDHVQVTPAISTGIAQINVADSGANQIVIVAAANKLLSTDDVEKAQGIIRDAGVLVCQLETEPVVAIAAMRLCGGISILNAAPALSDCDQQLFTLPDIFCVNENECEIFAGVPVQSVEEARTAINVLLGKGCKTVILTLGSQGALFASKDCPKPQLVPSPQVNCLDSTGAGDAFIGALAYFLANRKDLDLRQCIETSNYIAANSVTKLGTQLSFPESDILDQYFANKK